MSRILVSCFFIICLFAVAYGQESYRKGYVVIQSDTVEGFIKVLPNRKLHNSCLFKKEKNASHTEYSPTELRSFGIENYKRFESITPDSLTRFAELIVDGEAKLFKINRDYYVKKDEKVLQLKSELVEISKGQNSFRELALRFKKDLKLLLSDCKKTESEIDLLENVSESQLVKLLETYHSCTGKPYAVVKEKVKRRIIKASVFGGTGITILNLNKNGRSLVHLNNQRIVSDSPLIGASVDVYFPRSGLLTALNFRLQYTNANYRYDVPESLSFAIESREVSIEMHQVKFSTGITKRLNFSENLFILGGGTANFNTQIDPVYDITYNTGLVQTVPAFTSRKVQFGAWLGTRYYFINVGDSKIYLEYNIEMTSGPTKSVPVTGVAIESRSTATSHLFHLGLTF